MIKEASHKKAENVMSDNAPHALPQHPVLEGDRKNENKISKQKVEEKPKLFYTRPIFKYPEHDFY